MVTWDAPRWLAAATRLGELRDLGSIDSSAVESLAGASSEYPSMCYVATSEGRHLFFNRFGTPQRIALALGLDGPAGTKRVVDSWRERSERGDLQEMMEPPTSSDLSYVVVDPPGQTGTDRARWIAYPKSVSLELELRKAGVPNLVGVWYPPQGFAERMAVVSIKQVDAGHAALALRVAGEASGGEARVVVVVDEDIDIYNLNDVLWALMTRCDPVRDMTLVQQPDSSAKGLIDATKPWAWKERFAETISDADYERAIRERWSWVLRPDAPDPRSVPQ